MLLDSGPMNPPSDGPLAELLSIGSELLAGETVDTNAAHLGASLARLGIPLRGIRALPDDRTAIAKRLGIRLRPNQRRDVVSALDQPRGDLAAHVASRAGHEDAHWCLVLCAR